MSHPVAGHTYEVVKDGELMGFFQWFLGPPPTCVLQDVEGDIIYQGPYEPEDPVSLFGTGVLGSPSGDVTTSESPGGATIWCNCWQVGWRCRLRF